jgi:hypothetical protein
MNLLVLPAENWRTQQAHGWKRCQTPETFTRSVKHNLHDYAVFQFILLKSMPSFAIS